MRSLRARQVFLGDRFAGPLRLEWGDDGRLSGLVELDPGADVDVQVLLPGMPNLHSHAFQRAFSGLAERAAAEGQGSFWTWRAAMYRFVDRLQPDDVEAIAQMGQVEMLEGGFTSVGEFHYLHHDPAGENYEDVAELAARVLAASAETGIRMTLLPVLYLRGGFDRDGAPVGLEDAQRRFGHGSVDEFLDLFLRCRELVDESGRDDRVGIAPHSLRAVGLEDFADAIGAVRGLDAGAPVHVHIAEQQREVEDCLRALGKRPVQALLDVIDPDPAFCLVHATHVDAEERSAMAKAGVTAGLCPTTEANLGDGIFPLVDYLKEGGAIGIGTDSHVSIDVRQELALLEYGQRLRDETRSTVGTPGASVGQTLYAACVRGGAAALGCGVDQGEALLSIGSPADFVTLDLDHPRLIGHGPDTILDAFVFSQAGAPPIDRVFVRGQEHVTGGRHRSRDAVAERFRATMGRLQEEA